MLTEEEHALVVRNGETIAELLRIERLTVDELAQEARSQGIGSLRDVKVGILETDGTFSFVLHDRPPLRQQHRPQQPDVS